MAGDRPHPALVRVSDRDPEQTFSHPLNPRSEMRGVSLSQAAGLERLGVHLIRLPPGKEANAYHLHHCEEEWWYILEGRGIAEIDDQEHEVGPGDFMGFRTSPATPHHLRNDGEMDLVYLVGGERRPIEIGEFPRLGKLVLRRGKVVDLVDGDTLRRFWPPEPEGTEGA